MKYDFDLIIEEDNSLSKIIKQIEKKSVVLEFGPATGRMTKFLKEHLECKVYIVEIDEESAQKAAKYAEDTIVGDIEDFEWLKKWEDVEFDYIVFADVLEHLRDPQIVLSKTKLLLKDEGKTIVSVPNVAHNSIMINLYNNIFNYTPVGLLDNTHIHLFAYNTLIEFCNYAGYTPTIEDAVYVNVGENEVTAEYKHVNWTVQKELKKRIYNNVYQYVFTLQKNSYVKMHSVEIVKKILPYTRDYKFEVYFDKGQGWMEENSVSILFDPVRENRFIVPVSDSELIKEVRIDPIDCSYGLKLVQVVLHREKDRQTLDLNSINMISNAEFSVDNKYLFVTDAPCIVLKDINWHGVLKIEIVIEWVENQQLALDFLKEHNLQLGRGQSLLQVDEEVENKLCLMNQELEKRAIELNNRMDLINQLNRENDILKNDIKLDNEELERRAIELENRMCLINELRKENEELKQQLKYPKKRI